MAPNVRPKGAIRASSSFTTQRNLCDTGKYACRARLRIVVRDLEGFGNRLTDQGL